MAVTCTRMGWVAALRTQRAAPEISSDEMLIRRIAQGDQLAMRTLFGRHRVPLYRWLLRLVDDEALAEDLLSDVFLDVWRQAAAFDMGMPLRPPQAALDEIIEHRAPGFRALPAHALDRQQHLLAVRAHAHDDKQRDRRGFAVKPDADDGAVEDQPHDRLFRQRAGVPGLPVGL